MAALGRASGRRRRPDAPAAAGSVGEADGAHRTEPVWPDPGPTAVRAVVREPAVDLGGSAVVVEASARPDAISAEGPEALVVDADGRRSHWVVLAADPDRLRARLAADVRGPGAGGSLDEGGLDPDAASPTPAAAPDRLEPEGLARIDALLGPIRRDEDGRELREVVVDGWRFVVEVEAARRALLRERARRVGEATPHGGPGEVRAVIPGRVVAVAVAEGDPVTVGSDLLVVEAMKMQNEVRSPRDGVVRRVAVGVGESVELGDLLVVIE